MVEKNIALDPIELTAELIRCRTITPDEGGALVILQDILTKANFSCTRLDKNGVSNLFARWGKSKNGPSLCFNGHIDVVPTGDLQLWSQHPFSGKIENGLIYGRGATDMKSAVASFVAASLKFLEQTSPKGSIVIAITSDEEGPATDGTRAILDWMNKNNEKIDHCLVGEPTSSKVLGDTIKIGRRGSITLMISVSGLQGHVAYPEKATNPIPPMTYLLESLIEEPLDTGNKHFEPSSLVVTSIDTGNKADNIIPSSISSKVNIRYNDLQSKDSILVWIQNKIDVIRNKYDVKISLRYRNSAEPFIIKDRKFPDLLKSAIHRELNINAVTSTSGGTSDARFIKDVCPVLEFGLIGEKMHKIDESIEVTQISALTETYLKFIELYFAQFESFKTK